MGVADGNGVYVGSGMKVGVIAPVGELVTVGAWAGAKDSVLHEASKVTPRTTTIAAIMYRICVS